MRSMGFSPLPGSFVPQVHRNCPHNEVLALTRRVLAPLPDRVFEPLGPRASRGFESLRRVARRYPGHKWSLQETAESYQGLLRRRYLEAAASVRADRVSARDARLDCFLKAEKVNPLAKFQKPRLIFPRDPRYNLSLASRLKPFEHWLWGVLRGRDLWRGGSNLRVVAKGLSARQRANLIVRKFRNFRKCVVFEVDGKAFEAHVGPDTLKAEHNVYRAAYPRDKGLGWLLARQLRLEGRLPCGARFSRDGGRASGDFNTGMGNTMAMLACCVPVLQSYDCSFDILADGDNALVFLEAADLDRVVLNFEGDVLADSGFEMTLERPVCLLEEIRFGRSAPIQLGGKLGWTMVRELSNVMSGAFSSHVHLRQQAFVPEWLTGVAMCELSLALAVPMLQAWVLSVLDTVDFRGTVRQHPHRDYLIQGAWFASRDQSREVDPVTRESFSRAFGITPEAQLSFERTVGDHVRKVYRQVWREVNQFTSESSCPPGVGDSYLLEQSSNDQ